MASSKRDFGRAFDIPVGFSGDHVAPEPQARYSSPIRRVPGSWPEDSTIIDDASAPSSSSVFTTLSRFATSFTLEVFKIPERLIKRFTRPQQIIAVPVIREDGASKRRLVDAGLAPATPTSGGLQAAAGSPSPRLWALTPPTPSPPNSHQTPRRIDAVQSDDIDHSFDWPSDLETSTPPYNHGISSPKGVAWLQRPGRKIITPKTLRRSPATPMQKQLLKKQLRAMENFTPNLTTTELKKRAQESSVLSKQAADIAARYEAELQARQNQDADAQATPEHHDHPHPVATIDNDLSYLPDATDISSSFDSLRSPSPSPTKKKSIRWATHGRVKHFYFDEGVSDMLDTTLESIRSPVPKPDFDDDENNKAATDPGSLTFTEPEPTSDSDESVDGPSLDGPQLEDSSSSDSFSLDDPLEESQLSKELLSDLSEDFKLLLSKQPPPPPPPKPLIAPLTDEERAKLDELVVESNHGKNGSFPIIPDKISARDFGTLLPDQFNGSAKAWLNDEIVNQYLATIVKTSNDDCGFVYKRGGRAPPFHAFSSHWYNSILRGVKTVERWAGRVGLGGKQFLDAKVVFFPICDGSHWRLLAVEPKRRSIEYFDSLGWDGSKYIAKLLEYLEHELKEHWVEDEWTIEEIQRSSRQLNGSDCGVFVLLNALTVARGDAAKKVVSINGMLEARERLAMTIITGHPVELDY